MIFSGYAHEQMIRANFIRDTHLKITESPKKKDSRSCKNAKLLELFVPAIIVPRIDSLKQ